jgi:tight adherence protein B
LTSIIAVFLVLAGAIGSVGVVLLGSGRRRQLSQRVDQIARPEERASVPAMRQMAADQLAAALGALRSLFTFRMGRSWGVSANPGLLLLLGLTAAAGGWLFARFGLHLPDYLGALVGLGGFALVPRIVVMHQQRRSDAAFGELLPAATDMVVRVVRAGLPVIVAIRAVGQEGEPPLAAVFAGIADQTEIGVPLEEALGKASLAVGNADFRFFAVAVALQQATGGNLAGTLETLSEIIRRRRALRLKAAAATAEVRISGIVLGAIPLFVMGALLMVAPNYLDALFSDRRGNIIVGMALLLLAVAGMSMRAMLRRSLAA